MKPLGFYRTISKPRWNLVKDRLFFLCACFIFKRSARSYNLNANLLAEFSCRGIVPPAQSLKPLRSIRLLAKGSLY